VSRLVGCFEASLDGVGDVVKAIKENLPEDKIILLKGNLASGKTTLVKAFVSSLDLNADVSSPTFSIMNVYNNQVYHYDIYNEGSNKFFELGLLENLENEGYHFIEWADEKMEKNLNSYGYEFLKVEIQSQNNRRIYNIIHY
jgi:tRNA threonylcarbamoyladenosine biosynthesis protein TsaE